MLRIGDIEGIWFEFRRDVCSLGVGFRVAVCTKCQLAKLIYSCIFFVSFCLGDTNRKVIPAFRSHCVFFLHKSNVH